jgi:NADPH2:quinone reductase
MKAIICSQWCDPADLVLGDLPDPVAGPGEVVVAIKAAALNFFDILMVQGKYQTKPPFPFSPVAEIAGLVESVGSGVTDLQRGDRVASFVNYNGAREKVAVPAMQTVKIPDSLDYDRAAGVILTYSTALHALEDRADPKPGETLVVLGAAGGTGLAAIEIGKLLGLRVVACASSDEKLQFCKRYGADILFNYAKEDLKDGLKKIGGAKGIDIVFDPVGGDFTEAALRALGWEGRLLVVGFASGPIPRIPLNLALLKSCDIRGVFWGGFNKAFPDKGRANLERIVQWAAQGKLSSHVHATFPLAKTAEAMAVLSSRQAMGKVILHP